MNHLKELIGMLDTKGGHIVVIIGLLYTLPFVCQEGQQYTAELFGALLYSLRAAQKTES
jgi:hypothetical protein